MLPHWVRPPWLLGRRWSKTMLHRSPQYWQRRVERVSRFFVALGLGRVALRPREKSAWLARFLIPRLRHLVQVTSSPRSAPELLMELRNGHERIAQAQRRAVAILELAHPGGPEGASGLDEPGAAHVAPQAPGEPAHVRVAAAVPGGRVRVHVEVHEGLPVHPDTAGQRVSQEVRGPAIPAGARGPVHPA